MKNKVLLIGGGGFIGHHVYRYLKHSNYDPIIISRSDVDSFNHIKLDYIDILKEKKLLSETCCVIMLAWSLLSDNKQSIAKYFQDNLVKNMRFVEDVSKKYPKIRYIFISTGGAIYGNNSEVYQSESSCTKPMSPYGISKLAMEEYLGYCANSYGTNYLIARPGNPYGEGKFPDANQGIIASFLDKVKNDKPVDVWGDGSAIKDYLYIEDLAKGIVNMIDYSGNSGNIFNFGSGIGMSIDEIINLIKEVTKKNIEVNYLPSKVTDITNVVLDSRLAKKELNWEVETPFIDGMRKTWGWINSI